MALVVISMAAKIGKGPPKSAGGWPHPNPLLQRGNSAQKPACVRAK